MNNSDALLAKMRAMNQALLLGSLRQHKLTEATETLNAQLRAEIAERKQAETALRASEARRQALIFKDITERKRVEEARQRIAVLAASNRKLEQEVSRRKSAEKVLLKSEQHQKQLRERTRHLAHQVLHSQEQERLRISRELHDQVVQTLIGINVRLAALTKKAKTLDPAFRRHLALTQGLVAKSVETVHQFSRDLRPSLLDDLGLIPTLHAFLKTFMKDTGIRVSLTVFAGVEKLDGDIRTVLYRVAQEALTNVARHAKAHAVAINIQEFAGRVRMTIQDNGEGFKLGPLQGVKKGKRLGLVGMQERLEMIGGTFDIQCVKGHGTTVTAQIPIGKHARKKA